MKKFVLLYNAPAEAMATMGTATPEEKQKGMQAWMDWKDKMGEGVLDFGAPMMGSMTVNKDGSANQAPSEHTGYSLVQAESMEVLTEAVKSHPHLQWYDGCNIEIFECIAMG